MTEEFNLSNKIHDSRRIVMGEGHIEIEDVREFIKLLKERDTKFEIDLLKWIAVCAAKHNVDIIMLNGIIARFNQKTDKLAGDKLI